MTKRNRVLRSVSSTLLVVLVIIWMSICYFARVAWRIIRPTLFHVVVINYRMNKISSEEDVSKEKDWHERLVDYDVNTREMVIGILLSTYESDQNRVLGIESKARGVLTAASLVLVVNIAILNYSVIRQTLNYIMFIMIGFSFVYLVSALWASFRVEKISPRWVLDVSEVLSPEITGYKLAECIERNRYYETARTNLAESAIFDIARAFLAAILTAILVFIFSIT